MSVNKLLDPILQQGIKHTNFFEGRLLTGEDLRNQQQANREHDKLLGRAVGSGIVEGLEVELLHNGIDGEPPRVRVKKGLAINRDGDVIGLPDNDIVLALAEPEKPFQWQEADFYTCAGAPGVQHLPENSGIYILVMSPTAGYKDRAPKSGLSENGIAKGCGSKYIQEGVEFRLINLDPLQVQGLSDETRTLLTSNYVGDTNYVQYNDTKGLSKLRNLLAHICFGTEQRKSARSSLLKNGLPERRDSIGAISQLYDSGSLDDCDVALCLMYWTIEGLVMLDLWSVRRELTASCFRAPLSISTDFNSMDAWAMSHQFQEQINNLIQNSASPQTMQATDYFYYLPAAGVIPLTNPGVKGVSVDDFFYGMTHREPMYMEDSRIDMLMSQSFTIPPIKVSSDVMVWLYLGQENQSINELESGSQQEYVIFASGYMPYYASPHFDLSRWGYSNYISGMLGPEVL